MTGTRFFPVHIFIKDLSFMVIYWLLVRFVFTEINLQGISGSNGFFDLILGALFYNMITILISLVLYFPIVYMIRKIGLPKNIRLILTGFVLTLIAPIFYLYLSDWKHNNYYEITPEIIAWVLCFILSMRFYYWANNTIEKESSKV